MKPIRMRLTPLPLILLLAGVFAAAYCSEPAADAMSPEKRKALMESSIYDYKATSLDGKEVKFDQFKDKVLLIVNTASKCGYTPQYTGLQELYSQYSGKGLDVLGFPCNQFGGQEPGSGEEIATFCQKNYGVDFKMFEKIDVNGSNAHPLFEYLKAKAPGLLNTEAIKWNFTKFLVDRKGNVIRRYGPDIAPKDISSDIERLL